MALEPNALALVPDQAIVAAPIVEAPAPVVVDDLDYDDAILAQARADVARLDAGEPPLARETTPAVETAPIVVPPARSRPIMVPKAQLDEVLRSQNDLRLRLAATEGALALATRVVPAAPEPVQPAGPTIAELVAAQGQKQLDDAARFDGGELSMSDFTRLRLQSDDTIRSLIAQDQVAYLRQQAPAVTGPAPIGLADQQLLENDVNQQELAHPWVKVLNNGELGWLAKIATDEAAARHQPILKGPVGTLRIRRAVAELSDVYGPRWYPQLVAVSNEAPPAEAARALTVVPPAQRQAPASAGVRAVQRVANHPPNIDQMGSPGSTGNVITLETVGRMTEDQLMELPASTRARLLNTG